MRNLSFRAKAVVVSLAFLLPLVILAWFNLQAQQEQIDFARRERIGVATMQQFLPAARGVPDVRNAERAKAGGVDTAATMASGREAVNKTLASFEADLNHAGDPLALLPQLKKLQTAWTETAASATGLDAQGRTVFGPVVTASNQLMAAIGDSSSLVLDPDVDSFYVMNTLVLIMPNVVENLGHLWGWSTFAAAKGGLSDAEARRYTV